MNKAKILLYAVPVLLSMCKRQDNSEQYVPTKSNILHLYRHPKLTTTGNENSLNKDVECSKTIINDDFVHHIINLPAINTHGLEAFITGPYCIKAVKMGTNDDGLVDTVYTILSGKSSISFFGHLSNNRKNFSLVTRWDNAIIKDNSFLLYKNIKIGMSKKEFLSKLSNQYIECDSLYVNSEEFTYNNLFLFKNGLLQQITLTPTAD